MSITWGQALAPLQKLKLTTRDTTTETPTTNISDRFYFLSLNFNCTYVLSILLFRSYCLHDPTSNADLTYRAKIKFSVSHNLSLSDNLDELTPGQTRVPAKKKTGFDKCTQTTCPSSDSTERHSSRVTVATVMESSTQTTDDEHIPIPAAASEIPIMELGVNVTDRNLLLLLSQLCRCDMLA